MWVTDTLSRYIRHIAVFVVIVTLATLLLYLLSYEGRAKDLSQLESASSTVPVSPGPESDDAVKVGVEKKLVTPIKTITPKKSVMTTLFWVGESADADNAYITNTESYWDEQWQQHYGGVDEPNCRNGYLPCGFTPRENPFYFALPYAEYDDTGILKDSAKNIPWYSQSAKELLKNRWIAVTRAGYTCYAQWEDVGPNGEDDFAYVFGKAMPVNTFGARAGLDVSPALWKCLHLSDNGFTDWAFVDVADVPSGPWKDIVTTSGTSWGN